MARILPAEFDAQYGVTISTFDSHASTLFDEKGEDEFNDFRIPPSPKKKIFSFKIRLPSSVAFIASPTAVTTLSFIAQFTEV